MHNKLMDEDPLGQVKFLHVLRVFTLNFHVIIMRSEIKLIILADRLF